MTTINELTGDAMPIPVFRQGLDARTFNQDVYNNIQYIVDIMKTVKEYLIENKYGIAPIVAAYRGKEAGEVAEALHKLLRLKKGWTEKPATPAAAVEMLKEKIERQAVRVGLERTAGKKSKQIISPDDCRGFALADEYAPQIYVNSGMSKEDQLFALAHEMVHLMIGFNAGYALEDVWQCRDADEVLCANAAAEFLVPLKLLKADWKAMPMQCNEIAVKYMVTPLLIARRAHSCNLITEEEFQNFYNSYMEDK